MKQINWSDHILNFVAVIIGVSLAFYVNSSSEQRQERRELNKILQSLNDEIEFELGIYEQGQIAKNKAQSVLIQEVVDMLNEGREDSLSQKFIKCMNYNSYAPRNVTFNSILASGKLDLIEEFELRKSLTIYHEIRAKETNFWIQKQVDFAENRLLPWVMENTNFVAPDPEDLKRQEVINMLIVYKSLIDGKVRQYNRLVKEGESLKENIQKYLDEE